MARSASVRKMLAATGYLARPQIKSGPGIIVVHAWWGLNQFFRVICDRLGEAGFVAYAPDLFGGLTAASIEQAKQLRAKLDRKGTEALVEAALDHLISRPEVRGPKVGVVGFSLGVAFALQLARVRPREVAAAVLFYGTGGGKFNKVKAAFQGHFAEQDDWGAGRAKVEALEARIRAGGLSPEFHTYPATKHWFFEEDRPESYDKDAATLAWQRTLKFLRSRLR